MEPFPRELLLRPTPKIARDLLGTLLVRRLDDGSKLCCRIVETEAYTHDDPACHAFRGKSIANSAMFGPPGRAYVHINYGIHHCLNVVTQMEGVGEAVLIRALEPLESAEMRREHWAGPGRLTRFLGIRKQFHDHLPLLDPESELVLAVGVPVPSENVATTPRIGISKAADRLWRFYDNRSPVVSKR